MRLASTIAVAAACACGAPPPAATPAPPPPPEAPARRAPAIVTRGDVVLASTRDATHLYWVHADGVHRRALADPAAEIEPVETGLVFGTIAVIAAGGGRVFASSGAGVFATAVAGGEPAPPAQIVGTEHAVTALAVAGDELIVGTRDGVLAVPVAGGAPRALATGQPGVGAVAVTADHVYFTTTGRDAGNRAPAFGHAPPPIEPIGAVRRVARPGGAVEQLAGGQRRPSGLGVVGDRVWWCSLGGPALQSAPLAGGAPRVELDGHAEACAIDARGAVVRLWGGLVVERAAGGDRAADVRFVPDGRWYVDAVAPVIDDAWAYVIAASPWDGSGALLALPRQDEPVDLVATTTGSPVSLRAGGGRVYWGERDLSGTGATRVRVADPATGRTRDLATHEGWIHQLAVGGRDVYVTDGQWITRLPGDGGAPDRVASAGAIGGLTVHRDHLYWVDGGSLWARRRRGGEPFVLARGPGPDQGSAGAVDLVFTSDHMYLTTFGWSGPGVYQVDEAGRVDLLARASDAFGGVSPELVAIDDDLFAIAGTGTSIVRFTRGGDVSTVGGVLGGYVYELAGGPGVLYARTQPPSGDAQELHRVDPDGDGAVVLRFSGGYAGESTGLVAADDRAAYVAIEWLGVILALAHDAALATPPPPT